MSPDHRSTPAGTSRPDPVMPEVMDAMTAAVAHRSAPARRRRPRWLGRGTLLGLIVVLGSGTALAATGQWNPFAGTSHRGYSLKLAPAADRATLGVLRRPQTAQDRSPLIVAYLRRIGQDPMQHRVYLPSIRYLRPVVMTEMGGWNGRWHRRSVPASLVLMPSEVVQRVPLDMNHASAAAKRAAAANRPQHALCMWTLADDWPAGATPPMILQGARERGRHVQTPKRPPLLKDRVTGGGTCVTLHQLRTKGVIEGVFNYGELTGIVPDGVASVRITTRTGVVMTQRVRGNSFQLVAPGNDHLVRTTLPNGRVVTDEPPKASQFRHQTLQWLAADGRIIRHVPQ